MKDQYGINVKDNENALIFRIINLADGSFTKENGILYEKNIYEK
jgi:hypothetical protein